MRKEVLRREMIEKRRSLSGTEIECASAQIMQHLQSWQPLRQAQTCMVFLSMADEPQLDTAILSLLELKKTVCAPRLQPKFGLMEAAAISSLDNVCTGRLGLRMPKPDCPTVLPADIDIILVPGVAFDMKGARLGMGAGYYDRYLRMTPGAILAGIAWDFQIVAQIPQEQHDIPVHWLITENGIYDCMQGKI